MTRIRLKNTHIPLHYQIADYLLVMLERRELDSGDRLPPEEELRRMFGVSRTTVRSALGHLLRKGLLLRKQGSGTFWTKNASRLKKEKPSGINRQIFNITRKTTVKVLGRRSEKIGRIVSEFLRLPEKSEAVVFRRLRFIGSEPMSFTVNYLPADIGERIETAHLEKMMMLEALESVAGLALGIIEHEVEIARADREISEQLKIAPLDPVLSVKTSVFSVEGKPVELVWSYFVENRYKFRVVLDK